VVSLLSSVLVVFCGEFQGDLYLDDTHVTCLACLELRDFADSHTTPRTMSISIRKASNYM
jgi:hypothetical protein